MASNTAYRWLMKQSANFKHSLILSISFGILGGLLIIAQAYILADIIDLVYLHHHNIISISSLLWIFLSLIILRSFVSIWREITGFNTAQKIKNSIRDEIFKHLMACSSTQISKTKTGALTTTLIEQVEALHGFFADYLPQMILSVLIPIIILILVWIQNWIAGIILLITAPLIPLFMALIGMGVESLNQRNFQSLSRMSAYFLDLLQGLSTLSLFNQSRTQIKKVQDVSDQYRLKTMRILKIAFLSSGVLELFATISIALIAVYLGLGLLSFIHIGFHGVTISLFSALFILLLIPEFFMPLRQLGTFYHARAEAIGASAEIIKILNQAILEIEIMNTGFLFPEKFIITLNNIDFLYHENKNVLNHFNLSIQSQSCVALVGESGSGKTTVLQLLSKLIYPIAGEIKINDIKLVTISSDLWRSYIAFLTQHPHLFQGSIADNIRLAKPGASETEINTAAQKTGVLDFSNLFPDKLNTCIGENGVGLSGGQAQRVALARIYLRDAPIILLDEPTSHLDHDNIKIIQNLLSEWKNKKTIIIATHDEKIMNCADSVVNFTV